MAREIGAAFSGKMGRKLRPKGVDRDGQGGGGGGEGHSRPKENICAENHAL